MASVHKGSFTRRACLVTGLGSFAVLLGRTRSRAQTSSLEQVANLEGAGRIERLTEGAKQEREITVYTSLTTQDVGALKDAFEAKYGVKINIWRSGSESIVQRVLTEARAGRSDVDIILTNGPALEPLHREGRLQKVMSPHLANIIPEARLPHGEWTGTQLNVFVAAANTQLVAKGDMPKSYHDLREPKWKGKLGLEADDWDWFAGVVTHLGEAEGLKLFREIAQTNGFSIRKGHTLLTNLVASGEVALAPSNYNFTTEQVKRSGAPLEWFSIPPTVARVNGVAVAKGSRRPHAAILFYDFVIGEAQPLLLERGFVPVRKDIESPMKNVPIKVIDAALVLDEGEKWQRLYNEIIKIQPR